MAALGHHRYNSKVLYLHGIMSYSFLSDFLSNYAIHWWWNCFTNTVCSYKSLTILVRNLHYWCLKGSKYQKQSPRSVPRKRYSESMQQIYRRTRMPKSDLNKIVIEITLRHGCSPENLLHIFRTPFYKNTSGRLLLKYASACL